MVLKILSLVCTPGREYPPQGGLSLPDAYFYSYIHTHRLHSKGSRASVKGGSSQGQRGVEPNQFSISGGGILDLRFGLLDFSSVILEILEILDFGPARPPPVHIVLGRGPARPGEPRAAGKSKSILQTSL